MANAARVVAESAPQHLLAAEAECMAVPVSSLTSGERRMEAESYLAEGYRLRIEIESQTQGWSHLADLARVWQPSRLKGIQVGCACGTPFLAATQALDRRPRPRKYLSLERTGDAASRFVKRGSILVTCSGSVGRASLAYRAHENTLISHDLLRVEPSTPEHWGWLYACLRTRQAKAIMTSARYGHIIKHLEPEHLGDLPIPTPDRASFEWFNSEVRDILDKRDEARAMLDAAEGLFSEAVGTPQTSNDPEQGFVVSSRNFTDPRRRLEAAYHTPVVSGILARFKDQGQAVVRLRDVTDGVWWPDRFRRVFGREGAPYRSADELFALNPAVSKRILTEQVEDADRYLVRAGWLVMARSGQTYGLNGSVTLTTRRDEAWFLTEDLIRIIPRQTAIRPGYLLVALGHPELGRPIVIRNAYGTSVPHLDPDDVANTPIVRLDVALEAEIAELAESYALRSAEADELEDRVTRDAEGMIDSFIGGAGCRHEGDLALA